VIKLLLKNRTYSVEFCGNKKYVPTGPILTLMLIIFGPASPYVELNFYESYQEILNCQNSSNHHHPEVVRAMSVTLSFIHELVSLFSRASLGSLSDRTHKGPCFAFPGILKLVLWLAATTTRESISSLCSFSNLKSLLKTMINIP
jgi:hypothetical protein